MMKGGGRLAREAATESVDEIVLVRVHEPVVPDHDATRDDDVLGPAAGVGPQESRDGVGDPGVGHARDVPHA